MIDSLTMFTFCYLVHSIFPKLLTQLLVLQQLSGALETFQLKMGLEIMMELITLSRVKWGA